MGYWQQAAGGIHAICQFSERVAALCSSQIPVLCFQGFVKDPLGQ